MNRKCSKKASSYQPSGYQLSVIFMQASENRRAVSPPEMWACLGSAASSETSNCDSRVLGSDATAPLPTPDGADLAAE